MCYPVVHKSLECFAWTKALTGFRHQVCIKPWNLQSRHWGSRTNTTQQNGTLSIVVCWWCSLNSSARCIWYLLVKLVHLLPNKFSHKTNVGFESLIILKYFEIKFWFMMLIELTYTNIPDYNCKTYTFLKHFMSTGTKQNKY